MWPPASISLRYIIKVQCRLGSTGCESAGRSREGGARVALAQRRWTRPSRSGREESRACSSCVARRSRLSPSHATISCPSTCPSEPTREA